MTNPFRPYPQQRGPAKLLIYGDPGTMKTRRALALPGPRFMLDLEKGADEYGDLTDPGDSYLCTASVSELSRAVDYLCTLDPAKVGTVIVDPITVLWSAMQAAVAERMTARKKCAPEDVIFDVGVWSRLNRTHTDIVTRLINAPWHVVLICRGKATKNDQGTETGYHHEGHRSLDFLVKTVVRTRADGDLVVKDRSGTWREGHRTARLDLRELLGRTGTSATRLETPSEAAERDAADPAPSELRWTPDQQRGFFRDLDFVVPGASKRYEELAAWCAANGRPRPSAMTVDQRRTLLDWIGVKVNRERVFGVEASPAHTPAPTTIPPESEPTPNPTRNTPDLTPPPEPRPSPVAPALVAAAREIDERSALIARLDHAETLLVPEFAKDLRARAGLAKLSRTNCDVAKLRALVADAESAEADAGAVTGSAWTGPLDPVEQIEAINELSSQVGREVLEDAFRRAALAFGRRLDTAPEIQRRILLRALLDSFPDQGELRDGENIDDDMPADPAGGGGS